MSDIFGSATLANPALGMTDDDRAIFLRAIHQTFGHSRFTQDSPIRPDVWMAWWEGFARGTVDPRPDLILSITEGRPAGRTAVAIEALLAEATGPLAEDASTQYRSAARKVSRIAYTATTVQARLDFHQTLTGVMPLTTWWTGLRDQVDMAPDQGLGQRNLNRMGQFIAEQRDDQAQMTVDDAVRARAASFPFYRFAALLSLTWEWRTRLWNLPDAADRHLADMRRIAEMLIRSETPLHALLQELENALQDALAHVDRADAHLSEFRQANPAFAPGGESWPAIHSVSLNRPMEGSVHNSRRTIKADAAECVFDIDMRGISWAIIDSGIDARHPAFLRRPPDPVATDPPQPDQWPQLTRIRRTFDLTIIRDLQTLGAYPAYSPFLPDADRQTFLWKFFEFATDADPELTKTFTPQGSREQARWQAYVANRQAVAPDKLKRLEQSRNLGEELDLGWMMPLIEIPHQDGIYRPPQDNHGTHVAGILAADWPVSAETPDRPDDLTEPFIRGICPRLELYDIRAFGPRGGGEEGILIHAVDLVRALNGRPGPRGMPQVQGVNMSLSVGEKVKAHGTGQSMICKECNALVRSGVVVVAAAGNQGFQGNADLLSFGQNARDLSITDPGNADLVITVGSTHRNSPHTYGISYFSSRGPTADGRMKPDLVAPGERIIGPVPIDGGGNAICVPLDGTSMAAPHVSGVAALLMARHRELVGDPMRIKDILCRTATDLGRLPAFQGAGMVDALRALQSI